MKNNLYCLYNNLTKRYGEVLCSPTDEFCRNSVQKSITSNPDVNLLEFELCRVGDIDIENGIVTALPAPIRVDWLLSSKSDTSSVDIMSKEVVE